MNTKSYTKNNKVHLIRSGVNFIEANLELIHEAKEFIWLHTYIFEHDEITKPLSDALIKRAKEGIKVFFLVDGFGSRFLTKEFINSLTDSGIQFAWFSPIFSKRFYHIGRRLHSKILLIDNKKVLTGGINLSKKFLAPDKDRPWLDYSILIEGEEVLKLTKKNFRLYSRYFEQIKSTDIYLRSKSFSFPSKVYVKTLENDWMRFKNQIYRGHIKSIRNSNKRIFILATYFFPGKKFLNELKTASQRGVEINLIFTKRSDHPIERWSSKYLYSWFISNNINIYEWQQSIVHGKLILFDDQLCSIGSYNHNFMGHYGNIELNLNILDYNFGQLIKDEFEYIIRGSTLVTKEHWQNSQQFKNRILVTLSFIFANFITIVSLWFAFRKKDEN